jgi:hypothetical protein
VSKTEIKTEIGGSEKVVVIAVASVEAIPVADILVAA